MSRNTSSQGNTTPRLAPERILLINVVRYLLADLQGTNHNHKRLAIQWLYDTDDYDYNFYNVMSALAGRMISDKELERMRDRMVGTTLVPKWTRANYGDKSSKMGRVSLLRPVRYTKARDKKL